MGINFDEEIRALLILCSLPESCNSLVIVVSNSISRSLKFDDVISVILSEETHRKTLGGSTLGSYLNIQSEGRRNESKIILEIVRNQEESQRERGLNLEDRNIVSTMVK